MIVEIKEIVEVRKNYQIDFGVDYKTSDPDKSYMVCRKSNSLVAFMGHVRDGLTTYYEQYSTVNPEDLAQYLLDQGVSLKIKASKIL